MAHTLQAIEVSKRQIKGREDAGNIDNNLKLEAAESKLQDLKSNMTVLGKEAIVAMTAVEAQQQRLTLQRLIAMVWFIPHFSKCHFFSFNISHVANNALAQKKSDKSYSPY